MTNKIDKTELERIAALAKLNMGRNTEELENNLDAINHLKERIIDGIFAVELHGVDGRTQFVPTNIFREDIPEPSLSRREVLANARKNTEAGCISVPKMLERGE